MAKTKLQSEIVGASSASAVAGTTAPTETAVINTQHESSRWWQAWDAILLVGILSLIPLLYQYALLLWDDVELRFFPILPLISLALLWFYGRRGNCKNQTRAIFAVGVLFLSSLAAIVGAWQLIPWYGLLALILLWLSWMLARLGDIPWYRTVGWLLPMFLLLCFPLSPSYDLRLALESEVLASSSGMLDMWSVPHLPGEGGIATKNASIPISEVCRGLSDPYILLTFAMLLMMFTQKHFVIGLLTLVTVPLWSWLSSTAHLTVGLYLLEEQQAFLFTDQRTVFMQVGLLILSLVFIWITSFAFQNLLSPFRGYSSASNAVHKFYNWLVFWPDLDPSRKRRERVEVAWVPRAFWEWRPVQICLVACAGILLVGGGYSGFQIFGN